MVIYGKIHIILSGSGDYDRVQKEWDLWGPLVITLLTASLVSFSSSGTTDEAFINLFIGLWVGPLMITLNTNLLGAKK